MFTKKFFITFIAVFIVLFVCTYLIHDVLLASTYESEQVKNVMRSTEDITSRMWVMVIMQLVWAFFFTFFFAKGYENKGIWEGVRFGLYIGVFYYMVTSYNAFVVYQLPYSLTFQWFIYGLIQALILGVVAALLYKPKAVAV